MPMAHARACVGDRKTACADVGASATGTRAPVCVCVYMRHAMASMNNVAHGTGARARMDVPVRCAGVRARTHARRYPFIALPSAACDLAGLQVLLVTNRLVICQLVCTKGEPWPSTKRVMAYVVVAGTKREVSSETREPTARN